MKPQYNETTPKASPQNNQTQRRVVAGVLAQRFALSRPQARLIAELQGYGAFK